MTKICIMCKIEPLPRRHRKYCIECARKVRRQGFKNWYAENQEAKRERCKFYMRKKATTMTTEEREAKRLYLKAYYERTGKVSIKLCIRCASNLARSAGSKYCSECKLVAVRLSQIRRSITHRERKKGADRSLSPSEWVKVHEIRETIKAMGMQVDHIIPLSGCRICGAVGTSKPDNLQPLSHSHNASKGNRCQTCWKGSEIEMLEESA